MTANRRKLLMAYGLAEMASIQQGLRALAHNGDAIAGLSAEGMQQWIDDSAVEWLLQSGKFTTGDMDRTVETAVPDARKYLTNHVRELDDLLTQMKEGV
jgi:hypothetical protein